MDQQTAKQCIPNPLTITGGPKNGELYEISGPAIPLISLMHTFLQQRLYIALLAIGGGSGGIRLGVV